MSDSTPRSAAAGARPGSPLPRYRRAGEGGAGELPGLLLQPRDLAMIEDVWRYRWLTTSQIERLRACDEDSARRFVSRLPLTRRLKLLYHHRYLQRIARPVEKGSREPVYVLDVAGAKALRKHHVHRGEGEPASQIAARAPSQLPKTQALEHLLAVNEFRTCLVAACRASAYGNDPATLLSWQPSDAVKFAVSVQESGERRREALVMPDGFFTLRASGQRLFYFVEVDLGTEPGKTLAAKCRGYVAYWQSGGFARDFALPGKVGFRVLFVVPGARRMETVASIVRSLPLGRTMFLTTTEDKVAPNLILKPIFMDAKGEHVGLDGNKG